MTHDPLGNPVDRRHPWNQHTIPAPQKRDFDDKYSWTMSPRWFDGTDHLAAGHRRRPAGPALGDGAGRAGRLRRLRRLHRAQRADQPAAHGAASPRSASSGRPPTDKQGGRCPTRSSATGPGRTSRPTPPACALHFVEQALAEVRAGNTQDVEEVHGAGRGVSCGFTEAVRGVLSPPHGDPRAARSRTTTRTRRRRGTAASATATARPARTRTPCRTRRSSRRTRQDQFKGIDIMRAVRSFDPCLPCGVHMYLGDGKPIHKMHSPATLNVI